MGPGGLGSFVALSQSRIGIGKLVLSDYDVLEPKNLNRQQYFVDQLGMKKTEVSKQNTSQKNPYIDLEIIDDDLTEQSIPKYFKEVNVLAECFDDPGMKDAP